MKGGTRRYKKPVSYEHLKQLKSFKNKKIAARIRFAPRITENEYKIILRKAF